ncbi:hypothetical protein AQ490_09495 [Wenjunlia vitaminophila]|uniref:DUF4307 domain-containing protein n=1 Tax=Wenjunlia vitaminophila TaxID=76728 RepID=A0A0T6LM62_WENVI|nr:DUF4307 domain-containing protein [Wenjunlia vitaminophila]KRV46985.1 hypothetical protein AQ490_09495 [Wenjunlia vitaminophila]
MSATLSGPPAGRYGRTTAESSVRRLRRVGMVLAVAGVAVIGWFGWAYVDKQDISGQLVRFKVVSDSRVEVHLEVHKPKDQDGVCTLRSRGEDGAEVGLKDVRIAERSEVVNTVVELRTTARATTAELVRCQPAD